MFSKNQDALYNPANMFIWFLLAFQGGVINIGGFLAVHRFVSHVTGYATMVGFLAVHQEWLNMIGAFLVPIFYFTGVIVSAFYIERRRLRGRKPLYWLVLGMMILNFIILFVGGNLGYFGVFGEDFSSLRDYFLLFFLTYTCGLQNAVISSVSGQAIRTTHMTGLITDLGIGLVRLWTMRREIEQKEFFVNWCRAGILLSFFVGSIAGAIMFKKFQFNGFLFLAFISFFSAYRLGIYKLESY